MTSRWTKFLNFDEELDCTIQVLHVSLEKQRDWPAPLNGFKGVKVAGWTRYRLWLGWYLEIWTGVSADQAAQMALKYGFVNALYVDPLLKRTGSREPEKKYCTDAFQLEKCMTVSHWCEKGRSFIFRSQLVWIGLQLVIHETDTCEILQQQVWRPFTRGLVFEPSDTNFITHPTSLAIKI